MKCNKLPVVIVVFSGSVLSVCGKETMKPNFVVILTDDLTWRAVGYNNKLVKTPEIDRLAGQGIIFTRAYTASPVCVASRASLLTGLYPQTNGTVALDTESFLKNIVAEKKYKTLPQYLNEAGYSTFLCGKSHLGDPKAYGFQKGEETFDYDDKRAFSDATVYIDEIAAAKEHRPFFLWMAARQPHLPLKPAQEWIDLYSGTNIPAEKNFLEKPPAQSFYNQGLPGENFYRDADYRDNYKNLPAGPPRSPEVIKEFSKAYYATVSHLDHQIGELIRHLDSEGLLKNTVVIFLSDNGYFLGNHGLGNKLTMHEESVRVPFFIVWDKLNTKNSVSRSLISSIDIFPTILDLAGINIPGYLQGKSLKPILSDPSARVRSYVVSESVGVGGRLGTGHRMVVSGNWKFMLSDTGDEALFNLENDLYELENLIKGNKYQEKVIELKTFLKEWKKLTGDKKEIGN